MYFALVLFIFKMIPVLCNFFFFLFHTLLFSPEILTLAATNMSVLISKLTFKISSVALIQLVACWLLFLLVSCAPSEKFYSPNRKYETKWIFVQHTGRNTLLAILQWQYMYCNTMATSKYILNWYLLTIKNKGKCKNQWMLVVCNLNLWKVFPRLCTMQ